MSAFPVVLLAWWRPRRRIAGRMPDLPASTRGILRLSRPSSTETRALVDSRAESPFTYPDVGATRGPLPPDWNPHIVRGPIGAGEADFEVAAEAIRGWLPFDLGWVHVIDPDAPLEPGAVVGFTSRQLGVWTLNLCRVVYTLDEEDEQGRRFGFAYGTLAEHAVRGEELFLTTWDRSTDEVTFAIHKFSRPGRWWTRLAGPVSRAIQARFSYDALARMGRAVEEGQ